MTVTVSFQFTYASGVEMDIRAFDLASLLKGRASALPFALYMVCQQLSSVINTTTIKDTVQETEIINTTKRMLN